MRYTATGTLHRFTAWSIGNLPLDAMHPAHQHDGTDFISAFDSHPKPLPTRSTTPGARAMPQSPGTNWSILLWQHNLNLGTSNHPIPVPGQSRLLPTGAFVFDTTIATATTATGYISTSTSAPIGWVTSCSLQRLGGRFGICDSGAGWCWTCDSGAGWYRRQRLEQ